MQITDVYSLGRAIRQARLNRGWSQTALAARCGTSQGYISSLEKGKPHAEIDLVLRIMRVLDFHIMSDAPQTPPPPVPSQPYDVGRLVGMTSGGRSDG